MSLFSRLESQLKESLLERHQLASEILRLLKSYILAAAKQRGLAPADIPDDLVLKHLRRQIKKGQELASLYQAQQQTAAQQQAAAEVAVLEALLPEAPAPEVLEAAIKQVLSDQALSLEPRHFGAIIKGVQTQLGSRAEASQIVDSLQKLREETEDV